MGFNESDICTVDIQTWTSKNDKNANKASSVCHMVIVFVEDLFVGLSYIHFAARMSKMRPRRKQWPQNVAC